MINLKSYFQGLRWRTKRFFKGQRSKLAPESLRLHHHHQNPFSAAEDINTSSWKTGPHISKVVKQKTWELSGVAPVNWLHFNSSFCNTHRQSETFLQSFTQRLSSTYHHHAGTEHPDMNKPSRNLQTWWVRQISSPAIATLSNRCQERITYLALRTEGRGISVKQFQEKHSKLGWGEKDT